MKRLLLLLLLCSAPAFGATTFWTSSTGSDTSNNCRTQATPCNLANGFANELAQVTPASGDVINLCAGACDASGSATLTSSSLQTTFSGAGISGTSYSNALTIQPYCTGGSCETITIKPPTGCNGYIFSFDTLSYLIVGNPADTAFHLILDGDNCDKTGSYDSNGIFQGGTNGISISGNGATPTNHLRLQRIEIKNIGVDPLIDGEQSNHNEYLHLYLHDYGYSGYGHGEYSCGDHMLLQDTEIAYTHNPITVPPSERSLGVQFYCNSVTDSNGTANSNVADRLYIHDMQGGGITLGGPGGKGTDNILKNSLLVNNNNNQLGLCGTAAKAYNNTIVNGNGNAVYVCGPDTTYESKQNIIYGNAGSDYYIAGGSVTKANNVEGGTDPKFTNSGAGDYTLQATSPALDLATCLTGITADFNQLSRPQGTTNKCDAGAFERNASSGGGSGSPNTRTSRVTDNFTGAAGALGGGSYGQVGTSITVNRDGSGSFTASATSDGDHPGIARELTGTYTNKMYCTYTLKSAAASFDAAGLKFPGCGFFTSGGNGYALITYGTTQTSAIGKFTAGVQVATIASASTSFTTNQVNSLEFNGDTGQFWAVDDTGSAVFLSPTDSSYCNSGCRPAVVSSGDLLGDDAVYGDINYSAANGVLTVTGPGTGSTCVSGSTCPISWTSANITGTVNLYYLVGGQQYLIASPAYDASPYSWTVNAPASTAATVRVTQSSVTDDGSTFTILGTKVGFK